MPGTLILGIESSCDETSAAVVRDGHEVLSNVVASQLIHSNYGGVVPELASREHLRAIVPIVREAMQQAGVADVATSKSCGSVPSSRSRTHPPAKYAACPSARSRFTIRTAAR